MLAQRNSHASLVDGLVLSGGIPSFVAPEYDGEIGMAHGVEPAELERALAARDDFRAVFIVSPTYYGMVADVAGCAEVAHKAGLPLVVDQSWGPHFGFHPDLPPGALSQGADAVVTSTHKIVGSLTQSAMLHVADTGRIDPDAVARNIRLVRSTSPSSLLFASLDAARRQLAVHGEALLHETLRAIRATREKMASSPGVAVLGPELVGRPGVTDWDPLRIVLDIRGTGRTGYEVADALRQTYDAHVELATQATVLFIVGIAEQQSALERLGGDLDEVVLRIAHRGHDAADHRAAGVARAADGGRAARRVPGRRRARRRRRRGRADLVRVDRRLPAGDPGAAARRADHRRDGRLPARDRPRGRAPARRERPGVRDDQRAQRTLKR